jgi:hypothetical protein
MVNSRAYTNRLADHRPDSKADEPANRETNKQRQSVGGAEHTNFGKQEMKRRVRSDVLFWLTGYQPTNTAIKPLQGVPMIRHYVAIYHTGSAIIHRFHIFFWYLNEGREWCEHLKICVDPSNSALLSICTEFYESCLISAMLYLRHYESVCTFGWYIVLLLKRSITFHHPVEPVDYSVCRGRFEGATSCKLMLGPCCHISVNGALVTCFGDRLCGLVVTVPGHRSRGTGSISCATRFSE